MEFYDITDAELSELEETDIPEVRVSKFARIKNWFNSRKNRKVENDGDIPEVRISKKEKFSIWYNSKKEERLLKKEQKLIKKEEQIAKKRENIFEEYEIKQQKKQLRKEKIGSIKTWYNSKKEAKKLKCQEKPDGIYTKKDLIKSFGKCGLQGVLTCAAFAGALIAASSALSIGLLSSLIITTLFAASYKIFDCILKENIKDFNKIKTSYYENKVETEKVIEKQKENKVGFFKSLKNRFSKFKEVKSQIDEEKFVPISPEELKNETINVKDLIINTDKISNVKLTREQKIAKVKEECELGRIRVNNVTAYCVFVAKDDIKLQRFIRSEYGKENPKEKVQSFEIGDKKVLVLTNRPNFK